mgnify:FL=1
MSERPDGYYWARIGERWSVGYSGGSFVFVDSSPFRESEIDEIGPPCSRDDAEQLRLAREVLRALRNYASTLEVVGQQMVGSSIASTIELSAVRL